MSSGLGAAPLQGKADDPGLASQTKRDSASRRLGWILLDLLRNKRQKLVNTCAWVTKSMQTAGQGSPEQWLIIDRPSLTVLQAGSQRPGCGPGRSACTVLTATSTAYSHRGGGEATLGISLYKGLNPTHEIHPAPITSLRPNLPGHHLRGASSRALVKGTQRLSYIFATMWRKPGGVGHSCSPDAVWVPGPASPHLLPRPGSV
jgi:hypothetical protein